MSDRKPVGKELKKSSFPLSIRHYNAVLNSIISASIQLASFRGKCGDNGM
jgi:hypothetical protein